LATGSLGFDQHPALYLVVGIGSAGHDLEARDRKTTATVETIKVSIGHANTDRVAELLRGLK
jgi:hypothetical protein